MRASGIGSLIELVLVCVRHPGALDLVDHDVGGAIVLHVGSLVLQRAEVVLGELEIRGREPRGLRRPFLLELR